MTADALTQVGVVQRADGEVVLQHPEAALDIGERLGAFTDRSDSVRDIWDSVAEGASAALRWSPAQRAELDRRFAADRADPNSSFSWGVVQAELFRK